MRGRTARRVLVVLLLLVLGVLLPPFISVNRYRSRVTEAISRALGRPVSVSRISLKLLPQPALELSNFVVSEDPAFGTEPMLTAPTVTATPHFSSLWRERLEIGTLDLSSPSLNLVRRPDGHWNLEELVERASQVTSAPTSEAHPQARLRFPYIEASAGRINFKLGVVKKAFAFSDADFALWQDSENQWGIRLKGHPIRTDVSATDTGILRMDGQFQRASSLDSTPVNLKLSLTGGPLGQFTKLLYGRDRGWRGTVISDATLLGTPSSLSVTFDTQVDDFRRYDIALGEALRLKVHCTANYSLPNKSLNDLDCESPVGDGVLKVRGNAQGWPANAYDLNITAEKIPAERAVAFARHAKKDLPLDLTASGEIESVCAVHKQPDGLAVWSGGGRTAELTLHSDVLKKDLEVGELQFIVANSTTPSPTGKKRPVGPRLLALPPTSGLRLTVRPFPVTLGAASPATATAQVDTLGYNATLNGPADISRLVEVAKALGIATPGIGLAGAAQADLQVAGAWTGFEPPAPSGTLQLRDVTAELQGVTEPVQVASASVALDNHMVQVGAFDAAFTQGPEVSGSASFPIHCTAPETCPLHFDLHSDETSLARLNHLLNPAFRNLPWYHLLTIGQRHEDILLKLHASGNFYIGRLQLGPAVATNVQGTLELAAGQLRLAALNADLLGGRHSGIWVADFTVSPPTYIGSGNVGHLAMTQLGNLMHDNWAAGSVDADYDLELAGADVASLRTSAKGSADFIWSAGSLRHIALDGRPAPMAFSGFAGKLTLQNGMFNLDDARLQSGGNSYSVQGTASYTRELDIRLQRAGRSYAISGTLEKPRVEQIPSTTTQAALR